MKQIAKILILMVGLTCLAPNAYASKYKNYLPQEWEFSILFKNLPQPIQCWESGNRGTLKSTVNDHRAKLRVSGFPDARTLVCKLENGKSFDIDMQFLFGVDRQRRSMGAEHLEGEIRKIDIVVKFMGLASGSPTYNSHAFFFTSRGKSKHIYHPEEMYYAFFPERANRPTRRWKP
ncbi:MAG: hypothetical protein AB3N24_14430 [Leisingera sp.]